MLACQNLDEIGFDEEIIYELELTNFETKRMFHRMVRSWFDCVSSEYNVNRRLNDLLEMYL